MIEVNNKATLNENPLATFVLFAYNQEEFIREAVCAALAQTYSPLEIIISDDFSLDDTFGIMKDVLSRYSGPHKVLLNKNIKNLGIGGHIKKIAEIMTGEIVIMSAGDDVSMPERTQSVMDIFASEKKVFAVFSDVQHIDESGRIIEGHVSTWEKGKSISSSVLANNGGGIATGASYAYRRECFFWPWPYPSFVMNEDRILPFRASLLGSILYLNKPLVKYRLTSGGVSRSLAPEKLFAKYKKEHIVQLIETIEFAEKNIVTNSEEIKITKKILKKLIFFNILLIWLLKNNNLFGRLGLRVINKYISQNDLSGKVKIAHS